MPGRRDNPTTQQHNRLLHTAHGCVKGNQAVVGELHAVDLWPEEAEEVERAVAGPVVDNRDGVIDVNDDMNFGAEAGESFINRIIDNLIDQVVQSIRAR